MKWLIIYIICTKSASTSTFPQTFQAPKSLTKPFWLSIPVIVVETSSEVIFVHTVLSMHELKKKEGNDFTCTKNWCDVILDYTDSSSLDNLSEYLVILIFSPEKSKRLLWMYHLLSFSAPTLGDRVGFMCHLILKGREMDSHSCTKATESSLSILLSFWEI